MAIKEIEQLLIDRVRAIFGNKLRMVDSIPADWDDETLHRLLRDAPGVYVVFGGGPKGKSPVAGPMIDGRFTFVAVTTHAGGEKPRRIGDALQIGAYDIIELICRKFHGYSLDGYGALSLDAVDNLYTGKLDKQGAAIYSAAFTLPFALDSALADDCALADFFTYTDTIDVAPADGTTDASDFVTLPQAAP